MLAAWPTMSKIKWPALSSGSLGSDLAFNFGASGITASVGPEPRSLIALTPHLAARTGGKFHHAIGPNAIRSPMDEAFLAACGFQADSVRVLPSLAPNSCASVCGVPTQNPTGW